MICKECKNGKCVKKNCKKNYTKIVELVIDDASEELAIDAISLVSDPAIEVDFVYFGKEKNNLTFAKEDDEKRLLISPALIPNKQIFRYNPDTDSDYYVYFTEDTIKKASELYLKHNNHHSTTFEHENKVSGVITVESWIVKDSKIDKSSLYGYDLPAGTWMVSMKVESDEVWAEIKAKRVKGLSIEGYFVDRMEKMSKSVFSNEEILNVMRDLLKIK